MSKQLNYNNCKYLNNYDLLNKFNFKSIYEIPSYKKIEVKSFIKEKSLLQITQLQLKTIFFYYTLGFNNIFLNLNYKAANTSTRFRSISIESDIKANVTKNLTLDFLFNLYFILSKVSRPFVLSQHKTSFSKKSGKSNFNVCNLTFYLPPTLLLENREQALVKFKDFKFFISCHIKQPLLYFNKKDSTSIDPFLLKNIFPFWLLN